MDWLGDVDWQAVGTIVALVGVIVGSVLNLRSEKLTRQGLQQDRLIAESTAARSEAAAGLTEGYTRRVVDALEAMATTAAFGGSSEPAPRVEWKLEHHAGDTYRLTNDGRAKASAVQLGTHESLGGVFHVIGGPVLEPGEALTFMAAPSLATSDRTITVKWTQPDGTAGTWRYPLPARPRA